MYDNELLFSPLNVERVSFYSFILVYGGAMGPGIVSGRIRWVRQLHNEQWLCDKGRNVRWSMCRRLWHLLYMYVLLWLNYSKHSIFITFNFSILSYAIVWWHCPRQWHIFCQSKSSGCFRSNGKLSAYGAQIKSRCLSATVKKRDTKTKINHQSISYRLDFDHFAIASPEPTNHICNTDQFLVSGGSPAPTVCGTSHGDHSEYMMPNAIL